MGSRDMASLKLYVECLMGEKQEIDLDDVWIHPDVVDEDSMHALLVHHIALWALSNGNRLNDISGLTVDDEDGNELVIGHDAGSMDWIREVTQLYMWLIDDKHYAPDEAILAYVDNAGWKWFDFDDFQTPEDEYCQAFDGDYAEYAKETMSNQGESLEEHLERHFDYEEYGQYLIDDYSLVEWGGSQFLFDA
jgi:hypothetical protein